MYVCMYVVPTYVVPTYDTYDTCKLVNPHVS